VSYAVSAGNHRFSWAYEKDEATIAGMDAAWIDYIVFPPFSQTLTGALLLNTLASPPAICEGSQSQLYIFASGGTGTYSYNWTPAGTLNNAAIFNPVASPPETTTYNVLVTSSFFSATSSITLDVNPVPVTPVVTVSGDHLVSSASAGNQWCNSLGLIPGANDQTYYPTSTDTYYVIASNSAGCQSNASNEVVFGFTGLKTLAENMFSVYPNPFTSKLNIKYTLKSTGTVRVALYNSTGNEIGLIEDTEKAAGNYTTVFDGSQLAAGIYYCKIICNDTVQSVKVVKNK
jgi:hypothetical protein